MSGNEKRLRERTRLNREIYFRTRYMTEFAKAIVYDFSRMGALFSCTQDLAIDTIIHVVIPADNPQTPNLEVTATIIRKKFHPTRRRQFEYACLFEYRQTGERRVLHTEVKYRTSGMSSFENGLLWNISNRGALLSTQREFAPETLVHLIFIPDSTKKSPAQIIATIIRIEFYPTRRRRFGYGCRFHQMIELD